MWKIYLLEAIIALSISIVWVHIIDKNNDNNDQDIEFP